MCCMNSRSYVTQPTCWSLPYREAHFHRDTHHRPQQEYAHKNFRLTKPLSDPPKRRPWEEATHTPVCPCLTFRSVCTCNQGWVVAENPPTPQQHCQVASWLLWWRTSQNNLNNINFTGNLFQKNYMWSILTLFLAMTVTWPPPQYPSGGVLGTPCGCDFRGVTSQVDLTSWFDKLSLVKWFEEGPEARVTSQLDKRNLSSWLDKFHLCSKHKCRTLIMSVNLLVCTARSREDETRNARRNENRNPRWSKVMSLFKWAIWKETCDDHQRFRFAFQWPFRISSSQITWRIVWTKKIRGHLGKKLHENREIAGEWAVGAHGQLTRGANWRKS